MKTSKQEHREMSKLEGKVAVVTGASKGIGAEIARTLAAAGASVVVNYASSRQGADKVVADITAKSGKAIAVQGNVALAADVQRLFAETEKAFGHIDILVNNAGVFKFAPIDEFSEDEFHRQFNINVLGLILTTKEALKHFNPAGGSVINIGSTIVRATPPGSVIYTATKGAVDSITHVLSKELAPRKIRVNGLNPGGVETEGAISAGVVGGDFEKRIVANTPFGRMGRPNDIAPVAVFLASDDSGWVTGETLLVSGGYR
jgi:3-oxoacyl-[acyl-carrier protein] reductase